LFPQPLPPLRFAHGRQIPGVNPQTGKTEQLRAGRQAALAAAAVILALAATKGAIGYLFGVPILVADAYHSLGDIVAVLASGFGLWLASRKKTARFPYGLLRAENLAALLVSLLILLAGIQMLREGYRLLPASARPGPLPLPALLTSAVSVLASFFVSRLQGRAALRLDSQSLKANASEAFLDMFSSALAFAGILLTWLRVPYVQGVVVMLIAALILRLGLVNVWGAVLVLVDANLDPELQGQIAQRVNALYGVKGVSDVRIRRAGPFRMVQCTINTKPSLPLYKAHDLADQAEAIILERYRQVESVQIHVEPSREGTVTAIVPVAELGGLDSRVFGHFARAPFFMILRIGAQEAEIEDFYLNEFLREEAHVGLEVFKTIVRYRLDMVFTERIGEIAFSLLKNSFVDVYSCPAGIGVREALRRYRAGLLPALSSANEGAEKARPSPGS
jgi:cation diffusion facilitator family transporter